MKKILAFGASSSKKSINKTFANFIANSVNDAEVTLLDLNDFEMPIFSVDRENENGIPSEAVKFKRLIEEHDAVVVSFAEHNGTYSAAYKNILDWASRLEGSLWNNKPVFAAASSPGGRGGATVLGLASNYLPFMKANLIASFSLPSFYDNFSEKNGILNAELKAAFEEQLEKFQSHLETSQTSSQVQ